MNNENARNRPLVIESHKRRTRSNSAHAFQNSRFHEKYLFFENATAHRSSNHKTSNTRLWMSNKDVGGQTSLQPVLCSGPSYNNFCFKETESASRATNIKSYSCKKEQLYSNSAWQRSVLNLGIVPDDMKANVMPTETSFIQGAVIKPKYPSFTNSERKQEQTNTNVTATNSIAIPEIAMDKQELNLSSLTNLTAPQIVYRSCRSNYDAQNVEVNSDPKTNVQIQDRDWLCNSYLARPPDSFRKNTNSPLKDTNNYSLDTTHTLQPDCTVHLSSKLVSTSEIIHQSSTNFRQQSDSIAGSGFTSRAVSTAKITFKNSYLVNQKVDRKIFVLEACKKPQHLTQKTSLRLNEWLKSVMKLRNEQHGIIRGSCSEDQHVTSGINSLLDLADSRNSEFIKGSSYSVDLLPSEKNRGHTSHTQTQLVSTGINTDISFSTDDLHTDSCVSSYQGRHWSDFSETANNIQECDSSISRDGTLYSNRDTKTKFSNRIQYPHRTGKHFANIAEYGINNIKDKNTVGNKVVDSDLRTPKININVTSEEEHANYVNAPLSPTLYSSDTDMSLDNISLKGHNSSNVLAPHLYATRGPSLHCMFSCGHSIWDDDEVSRYLASPRNSICSNSSLLSYKSSNADSAVDLGPLDDDRDFEFAEFLVRQHHRRFSLPGDSLAFLERRACDHTLASISVDRTSNAVHTPYYAGAGEQALSTDSTVHARISQESSRNSSQSISFFNTPDCLDKQSSLMSVVYDNDLSSKSEEILQLTARQCPHIQVTGFDYTSLDPDNMNCNSRTEAMRYPTGNIPMVGIHNIDHQHRAFHEISKEEERVPMHVEVGDNALSEAQRGNTRKLFQPYIIPALIFSDHSDISQRRVNTAALQQEQDAVEYQLPSRPTSSLSSSDHSLSDADESGFARSLSASSFCSTACACSTCSEKSGSELESATSKDEQTAEHVLQVCSLYDHQRRTFWPSGLAHSKIYKTRIELLTTVEFIKITRLTL